MKKFYANLVTCYFKLANVHDSSIYRSVNGKMCNTKLSNRANNVVLIHFAENVIFCGIYNIIFWRALIWFDNLIYFVLTLFIDEFVDFLLNIPSFSECV